VGPAQSTVVCPTVLNRNFGANFLLHLGALGLSTNAPLTAATAISAASPAASPIATTCTTASTPTHFVDYLTQSCLVEVRFARSAFVKPAGARNRFKFVNMPNP